MALRSSPLPGVAASTYEEYVAARWSALYRTAYLLAGNHADAEDLAQATLVKAYLSWSKVTAASSPDAYVRRILTNAFLSSRRPLRVAREHLVDHAPDAGMIANLVEFPAVPKGQARFRMQVMSGHTDQNIRQAVSALRAAYEVGLREFERQQENADQPMRLSA